ncbi:MAG: M28 family peptidase [Chloroflexota bacterium]
MTAPLIVSARRLLEHMTAISDIGPRPDASDANRQCIDYVESGLQAAGLTVDRLPLTFPVLNDVKTALTVTAPYLMDVMSVGHLRTGVTAEHGIEAPLVPVGKLLPRDLVDVDLRGKIALAFEDVPFEGEQRDSICYFGERVRRAQEHGAVALVFADYRTDGLIMTWGIEHGLAPIPCLAINYADFDRLRHLAVLGDARARVTVTATVGEGRSDVLSSLSHADRAEAPTIALVGTHTDTVPTCSGANDNGSGLALLIELARVLTADARRPNVLYVATTGEEAGSIGAEAFCRSQAEWLRANVDLAIAFDQIGGTEVFLSAHGSPILNEAVIRAAAATGHLLRSDDEPGLGFRTGLSDVQPFAALGIPSAYLGGWTQDPVYHTAADQPGRTSPNSLKALGDIIANMVCDSEIATVARDARGD